MDDTQKVTSRGYANHLAKNGFILLEVKDDTYTFQSPLGETYAEDVLESYDNNLDTGALDHLVKAQEENGGPFTLSIEPDPDYKSIKIRYEDYKILKQGCLDEGTSLVEGISRLINLPSYGGYTSIVEFATQDPEGYKKSRTCQ